MQGEQGGEGGCQVGIACTRLGNSKILSSYKQATSKPGLWLRPPCTIVCETYLECISKSGNAAAQHQEVTGLDIGCGKFCWLIVKLGYAGIKAVLESLTLDLLCSGSNIDSLVCFVYGLTDSVA